MTEACSTSDTAFLDYGLPNGQVLVPATYYALAARDEGTFGPTPEYVHRIADTFRTAFVRRAALPVVPEPVDAAVEDAVTPTLHEFTHEADLRTEVLPTFYRRVASYTCTYLQWYPDGGVGVDVEG
ncbi:MAG: hypothetical protein V5A62_15715 [Haloarculaceae archaeon]